MKIVLFTLAWSPVFTLFGGLIILLLLDLLLRESARNTLVAVSTLVLVATAGLVIYTYDQSPASELFRFQEFYLVFALFGLLSSIIVVFSAWKDMTLELDLGIFFSLLMLANIGGLVIASSRNFIPLYIGYELMSIPTYAMVAFRKNDRNAAEAALKIFLLGALSSAMIIYGLAMLYGATGTLAFNATLRTGADTLKFAAVGLIAAGCSFKIGLAPFHLWIPDVYSGAPISVVNFLAASSKKMAFAFVFQLFFFGMPQFADVWAPLFFALAALSIVLGNAAAVIQTRVMRILAYSTVAQAGYIAVGIATFGYAAGSAEIQQEAMRGIIFHVAAHILMKGGAIMAVLLVVASYGDDKLENFRGLYRKRPLLGFSLTIALLSLMGIPPLAGFFGKFFLFLAAVDAGLMWLAVLGFVGSAVSIYYYARIIRTMAEDVEDDVVIDRHLGIEVMLVIVTLLTIGLGLFGTQFINLASEIIMNSI